MLRVPASSSAARFWFTALCAACAIGFGALGASGPPPAQTPRPAPPGQRDRAPVPITGTAALSGLVRSDEPTPHPIRRALVTARHADSSMSIAALTDDQGRFAITGLPAGRFSVSVGKPGYPTCYYGARLAWRSPGTPLQIAEGEQRGGLDLTLIRGAVIAGRIVDQFGAPQPNARVVALQRRRVNGRDTLVPASGASIATQTDNRGAYRIFGLPPGDYLVGASGGPSSGGVQTRLTTPEEAQWMEALRRGAIGATAGPPPPTGSAVILGTVFHPGVADPAAAGVITLQAGDERTGVDFAMQLLETAELSGVVVRPDGEPAAGVRVLSARADGMVVGFLDAGGPLRFASSNSRGEFHLGGVLPGQYVVTAQAAAGAPGMGGGRGSAPSAPPAAGRAGRGAGPTLWALAQVDVAGQDIDGIRLELQPGLTIQGEVTFEGGPPPAGRRISVALVPPQGATSVSAGASPGEVAPDGTFTLESVVPGTYRVSASVAGGAQLTPFLPVSATVGGRDALDRDVEIGPGTSPKIHVTFTDRLGELSGRILDGEGRPAPGLTLIVFSADRAHWERDVRYTRTVPPTSDGAYQIRGLLPGDYCIAALGEVDLADLGDESFYEQLAAAAIKVTITAGETTVQDIRIAG